MLQAAAAVPDPLLWATPVGKAYRLSASVSAPDLSQAAISFGYNPTDIPEGMENWLRLYYYPLDGGGWRELPTALDAYNNMASAPCQGQGWYALMAAVELSLSGPGWEAFSYPLAYTQSVSQALLSIDDAYTSVYWYNAADPADPWKLFDRRASAYANDLSELRFAEAYWIHLSQAVTLTLGGGEKRAPHSPGAFPWPPATFYGQALPGASFVPAAGMTVNAWVNGTLCGQALTELYAGQVVYDINVNADTPFSPGCGAEGRRIRFQVDGRWANAAPLWNNDRAWELPLAFDYRVFLPSIQR